MVFNLFFFFFFCMFLPLILLHDTLTINIFSCFQCFYPWLFETTSIFSMCLAIINFIFVLACPRPLYVGFSHFQIYFIIRDYIILFECFLIFNFILVCGRSRPLHFMRNFSIFHFVFVRGRSRPRQFMWVFSQFQFIMLDSPRPRHFMWYLPFLTLCFYVVIIGHINFA